MKKISLIIIFVSSIVSFSHLYGQKDPIRDEFLDAEFFLNEEQYSESLQAYFKVYNSGFQDNSNINYRIGVSYTNIPGEKIKAIPYLEKASANISSTWKEGIYKEITAPPDTWLYLGNAYRIDNQLDKAIEAYNKFIELNPNGIIKDSEYASQQIEACLRAKKAIASAAPAKKENLGRRINSNQNNFQPVFSGDGNSMSFMNSLPFYDAIYFSRKVNNKWTNTINITPQIESDGNQFITSLSNDGKKMYLVKVSSYSGDIMESEYVAGRWTKSVPLNNNINTKYFESHASISPDGKTLYFTSNRKESFGDMDIFMSETDETGKWGPPVNLGSIINTILNEEAPYICSDGKTLFFSSQGHETIGGFDIFYTVKLDDETWSKPVALPYPVNTTDDDLFFFPVENGKGGYMSLFEKDGYGSGDIYFINLDPDQATGSLIIPKKDDKPEEKTIVESVVKKDVKTEAEKKPVETIKYLIKPVYFDFDKYSLSDEINEKLNLISGVLNDFPDMKIEVNGYTDAIGSNQYNLELSERRATAVTNYLISKGVDKNRLQYKGLGNSEPAAANRRADGSDSPEGRRFNRRVEFRVLVNPENVIILQENEVPDILKIN